MRLSPGGGVGEVLPGRVGGRARRAGHGVDRPGAGVVEGAPLAGTVGSLNGADDDLVRAVGDLAAVAGVVDGLRARGGVGRGDGAAARADQLEHDVVARQVRAGDHGDRERAGDVDRLRVAAAGAGVAGERAAARLVVGQLLDLVAAVQDLARAGVDERAVGARAAALDIQDDRLERCTYPLRVSREGDQARALADRLLAGQRRGEPGHAERRPAVTGRRRLQRGARDVEAGVGGGLQPRVGGRQRRRGGRRLAARGRRGDVGDAPAGHAHRDHPVVAGRQAAEALAEQHGVAVAARRAWRR